MNTERFARTDLDLKRTHYTTIINSGMSSMIEQIVTEAQTRVVGST